MVRILIISIISILFFFCLYLLQENKKLKTKLDNLEKAELDLIKQNLSNTNNEDLISIKNISEDNTLDNIHDNIKNNKKNKDNYKTKTQSDSNRLYQKNTINKQAKITSPVSITNNDTVITKNTRKYQPPQNDSFDMNKLTIDLNEFIKKSEKVVPVIKTENKKSDYLKEVSKKLSSEVQEKTIELTDYEKNQEENAIISYQELLSVKDKISIIEDDDLDEASFIEELKKFREGL